MRRGGRRRRGRGLTYSSSKLNEIQIKKEADKLETVKNIIRCTLSMNLNKATDLLVVSSSKN